MYTPAKAKNMQRYRQRKREESGDQIKLFEETEDEKEEIPETIKLEKKYDPDIKQLCLHNEKDICLYLASAPVPCKCLCNGFVSTNTSFHNRMNKRLKAKDKIKTNGFVTMWHINKAIGIYPDDDSVQSKVRI